MPEIANTELHEIVHSPERNPYRVLRFVPTKFLKGSEDSLIMKRVDFVHRDLKLLLFKCELVCSPGSAEASMALSDPTPLLRYYLEPDFSSEIDFAELLSQLDSAVCHILGIVECGRPPDHALYDFVTGPRWPEWLASHDEVPTLPSALLDYMPCGQ